MEVRILGPLEVVIGGEPVTLSGGKGRTVLAALAIHLGEVVSTERLIEAGWGARLPADPANTLQYQISRLRRAVEPDPARPRFLLTRPSGYLLTPEGVSVDAAAFERLLEEGREAYESGQLAEADSVVGEALALWRGPALADFKYEEFARSEAERLEELRITGRELQIDVTLARGRAAQVVPELEQLTGAHPLRERLWARLMTALFQTGRQSDALRAFARAAEALAEIGVEPGAELKELEERILTNDPALGGPDQPPAPRRHNLPETSTTFVGRATELDDLEALIESARLITLTGAAGSGKTRLAIEAARRMLDRFPHGVWLVRLDLLENPVLIAAEIARVAGLREDPEREVIDTLTAHLAERRALLILDNCEHLVETVAELCDTLLARCKHLHMLATSQVSLALAGETLWGVEPLPVPGHTASIYDRLENVGAVRLFLDRAYTVGAQIDPEDSDQLATVSNIVSALDGLPLAVELAAARSRSMSLSDIARGLGDRFTLLGQGRRAAEPRQRTLRGAVEWSLGLLDDHLREVLAQLSVFSGGFDAAAAAAVTGSDLIAAHADLATLVDRSLVRRVADVAGSARYSLLETLRQHGAELLEAAGQTASARSSHLGHYVAFAEEADEGIRGPDQMAWLARLDADYENLRSALAWSLGDGSLELGVMLGAALGRYWDWRGQLKEGSEWVTRLADRAGDTAVPGLVTVLSWRAFFAWEFGDLDEFRRVGGLVNAAVDRSQDPRNETTALLLPALSSRLGGDLDDAHTANLRIMEVAGERGDRWMEAWAMSSTSLAVLRKGDVEAAESWARQTVDLFTELGDRRGIGWGRIALASAHRARHDLRAATVESRQALRAACLTRDDRTMTWALELLAEIAEREGDLERAARLYGAAHPLRSQRGIEASPSKIGGLDDLADRLRGRLGDRYERLHEEGRADPSGVISTELSQALPPLSNAS